MVGTRYSHLSSVIDSLLTTFNLRDVLAITAEQLGQVLGVTRCVVMLAGGHSIQEHPPLEWSVVDPDPAQDRSMLSLVGFFRQEGLFLSEPLVIHDCQNSSALDGIRQELDTLDIRSILAAKAFCLGSERAVIILSQSGAARQWKDEEIALVEHLSSFLGIAVENCLRTQEQVEKAPAISPPDDRYRRLVEHSDAIMFHTDEEFSISFISRRALDFFGVGPEDFVSGAPVRWFDLVHVEDRKRVKDRLIEMQRSKSSFDEEFRVINHITGRERWLLTKLLPVLSDRGDILGWDGFGIDITSRREAQEALDVQSKKVRALYTVSSAIRGYLDPSNIASRGVAALCEATGADAGLCYLFTSKRSDKLNLVAHHGFSTDFSAKVEASSTLPSLSMYVARNGQPVVVADIRNDPRASKVIAEEEGLRSAVLVPISVEDERLGTLGLFHRDVAKFDGGDVMLVSAAANQIGLAARQATLFSAYRRQTKNLAALYRINREISRFLPLEEIFQQAFSVLRDELGLKRLWLGLLNESGTRIVGQAAHGPGWRRQLVQMNVEVSGKDNPIVQVISEAKPIVVDNPEDVFRQFGVRRLFSHLEISSVVLVPLISEGQILGVLAVQPGSDEVIPDEEITLLLSLASEIAAVLSAKRLEERIAEGDKMRTAGLLAAGIAHNFNNLLQAILGQASLLKMQQNNSAQAEHSADIISEAATKGAGLVKQLLSFANLEEPSYERCDLNAVIERGEKPLKRLLRDKQELIVSTKEGLPRAYVDSGQVLRILNNLVTNAVQAMPEGGIIQIFTDSVVVGRSSPHYEVPYGSYIRIGVRDNGRGMDAETKRRCFEPFFTTRNVDPASGLGMSGGGLGLAVAYALARRNGGRLVVESRPERGSTFTLYLPIAEQTDLTEEPVEHIEPELNGVEIEQINISEKQPGFEHQDSTPQSEEKDWGDLD